MKKDHNQSPCTSSHPFPHQFIHSINKSIHQSIQSIHSINPFSQSIHQSIQSIHSSIHSSSSHNSISSSNWRTSMTVPISKETRHTTDKNTESVDEELYNLTCSCLPCIPTSVPCVNKAHDIAMTWKVILNLFSTRGFLFFYFLFYVYSFVSLFTNVIMLIFLFHFRD